MKYYLTYCDFRYIDRVLVLNDSMLKFLNNHVLYLLCLDSTTFEYFILNNVKNITPISINDFNNYNKTLNTFRNNKEFYFSLTPSVCIFTLKSFDIEHIIYIDADTMFYSNILEIEEELIGKSIGIVKHNYRKWYHNLYLRNYGDYNVGFNYFKNNNIGMRCLERWKYQCDNKVKFNGINLDFFSDQIYLNEWPNLYNYDLLIFKNKGLNAAPRIISYFGISNINSVYYIGRYKLVFFHFIGLKKIKYNVWDTFTSDLLIYPNKAMLNLYSEYILKIEQYSLIQNKLDLHYSKNIIRKCLSWIISFIFPSKIYINK
jgi:hypothetical protein